MNRMSSFVVLIMATLIISGCLPADEKPKIALKAEVETDPKLLEEQQAFWNFIKDKKHLKPFQVFLSYYESGLLVEKAKERLTELTHLYQFDIRHTSESGRIFSDCPDCPEMVVIPSGSYAMGDINGEGGGDEIPIRRVTISTPFAVGRFEVSNAQYNTCVASGSCRAPLHPFKSGDEKHPVVNISWDKAKEYVSWLSKQTGQTYRLLSEAEWEYVARGGVSASRYWGNEAKFCQYSNSGDLTAREYFWDLYVTKCHDGQVFTAPIGSYEPNDFGVHDILGNVYEWTEDCWHPTYAGGPVDGSAWVEGKECQIRVLRGGSWFTMPQDLRSSFRLWFEKVDGGDIFGLRVARVL